MTHSKEWMGGYNAALDAIKHIAENRVEVAKELEEKAKAENYSIKADFIGTKKDTYEEIIKDILQLKEVYQ